MAITDNNFTSEELEQVITANPEVLKTVTGYLTTKEYLVADKAARDAFEGTISTRVKSELTSQHATHVENKVKEITGIDKKDPQEKWTEYYERVLTEKASNEKILSKKLADLEGKSDISAAEREQLNALRDTVSKKETEFTSLQSKHEMEITRLKAENKIYANISAIDASLKKDDILKDAIQIVRDNAIEGMIKSAKIVDGVMVFVGQDGKPLMTADKTRFLTDKEIYAEKMDKFIDKGKVQPGAGGDPNTEGDGSAIGNIKSQVQLNEHLSKKGLVAGTKEFTKEFNRLGGEKLPVRI